MDLLNRIIKYDIGLYQFFSNNKEGYLHYILKLIGKTDMGQISLIIYPKMFNFPLFIYQSKRYIQFNNNSYISSSGTHTSKTQIYHDPVKIHYNGMDLHPKAIQIKLSTRYEKWPNIYVRNKYVSVDRGNSTIVSYNI
jgi:hypothetical protein